MAHNTEDTSLGSCTKFSEVGMVGLKHVKLKQSINVQQLWVVTGGGVPFILFDATYGTGLCGILGIFVFDPLLFLILLSEWFSCINDKGVTYNLIGEKAENVTGWCVQMLVYFIFL